MPIDVDAANFVQGTFYGVVLGLLVWAAFGGGLYGLIG
jgi:hypothetical protein